MNRKVDDRVLDVKWMRYCYSPGGPMVPVLSLNQKEWWRGGAMSVHLVEGLRRVLVLNLRSEERGTYTRVFTL